MKNRKIISAMLAMTMALSMAGCAGDKKENETNANTQAEVITTQAAVPTTQAAEETTQAAEHVPEKLVQLNPFREVSLPESEALDFVEKLQIGWNLGNTFDATDDNAADEMDIEAAWCGVKTTQAMIQTIADAGFKTIRIPVSWHNHVDANDNISKAWMDRVQEVVDWALDADMYVIINIHHDNEKGFMYPSYSELDRSKTYVGNVWKQIAERFADYDEHLIFETLNEPRQAGTDHEWWINASSAVGKECIDCINQLNQVAVDAIRAQGSANNKARYIMAPGYAASPDFALTSGYAVPEDKNASAENRILISVHAYRPYNFALAGENESNSTTKFSINNSADTGDIDSFMKQLYTKFTSKGIGVVIGEFGARMKSTGNKFTDVNNAEREELAAYYAANSRNYGMTAVWWDNNAFVGGGENFGLLQRERNQIFYPSIVDQMIYYSKKENIPR